MGEGREVGGEVDEIEDQFQKGEGEDERGRLMRVRLEALTVSC